ncbi:MAG: ABC-2 transporter permease [Clostridia bacterium]|nr:ABC-2 transporter permease [Clostridia bacterium]
MKGLILKDGFTLMKQAKLFLVMILIFSIVPVYGSATAMFTVVFAAKLSITSMSYDERSKWNTLAAMMPYSDTALVLSKYLLAYICILAASVLSVVGGVIRAIATGGVLEGEFLIYVVSAVCLAALMVALVFAFIFRFGVEKGRLAYLASIVLVMVIGGGATQFLPKLTGIESISAAAVVIILAAFTIVVSATSIALSVKFYKKNRL